MNPTENVPAGAKTESSELLNYQLIEPQRLNPYQNNAKKHPAKQVHQIAESIRQFGFISPIIVDDKLEIVAGHGRWEAAKHLKLEYVPILSVKNLTAELIRAYRLADNQLTTNTGYDDALLKIEIQELSLASLDFDLEDIGFETATIDLMLSDETSKSRPDPDDDLPEVDENAPTVTQLGDVWVLGQHRLICGDALSAETYDRLMRNDKADMCFTDPPYNVPIDGHVCGSGSVKHGEFAMASGEMSEQEFIEFLAKTMALMTQHSRDGALHYICMDWRHMYELLTASRHHYGALKNICVWNKDNGGMGSFYRSKHELVAVLKHGNIAHQNNIQLGKHGRYRTNVWDYRGVNSIGNQDDLAMHPTVKPVLMIADAIKDCTRRNQIVLDPFAGSGSTLIACEKSGRLARCIELEPKYCDVIIRRWQKITDEQAIHETSGDVFNAREAGNV